MMILIQPIFIVPTLGMISTSKFRPLKQEVPLAPTFPM